jgi:hypothetical protein
VYTETINNWVQTITGIAIVVGLALVVIELQQNRDAVSSQLSNDGFQIYTDFGTAMLGEDAADVIAKACETPSELTTADLVILDFFYSELERRTLRLKTLEERGGFYGDEWRTNKLGNWTMLFETSVGRAYWKLPIPRDQEVQRVGDALLENWTLPDCTNLYGSWRKRIAEELRAPTG